MKNKNRIYLFVVTFLFLSTYFVLVDSVKNVAKADCGSCVSDCVNYGESEYNCTFDFCSNECGQDTPGGNNEDVWECEPGYVSDGKGNCVSDGCPVGYNLVNGECVDDSGGFSQCDYGYLWDGKNCVAADSCPDGSALVNGRCQNAGGETVEGTCDPSPSCWFYNCCDRPSSNNTPEAKTPEEIAAAKRRAQQLEADAVTASKVLNNSLRNKNAADNILANCGNSCTDKQREDAARANQQYLEDQAKFDELIAQANAANAGAYPDRVSTGIGLQICANGMVALVCSGGTGSPIVAGLSTGGGYGGGGGGYYGSYGSGGVNTPKCGNGFEDIGGVCFPVGTGLSEAPISVIATNLFSWLMMLFTTLAILAFVFSGVQYFLASGDESLAETAKDNAKNAMIGIVVGLSGFIIIKAIAALLSGQSYFF